MTQLPLYLTPRQAADALTDAGVTISEDAVRRWCREDLIPSISLPGGTYRIRREEIEAILSGKTKQRADAAAS